MADVFSARDLLLDRQVAVKVLFPEFATDANFVERFRREAQSAASLSHPNIVNVYDWGKYEGTYFIVMEEVQGRTARRDPVDQQAAHVEAGRGDRQRGGRCTGVRPRQPRRPPGHQARQHPDRLERSGEGRRLRHRPRPERPDRSRTSPRSVRSWARRRTSRPSRRQGAQPDPRSDLYSLGIVMYEMVAGKPPFTGENPVSIAYKQVHDAPQPLVQIVADVPRSFEAIVAKLLAQGPQDPVPECGRAARRPAPIPQRRTRPGTRGRRHRSGTRRRCRRRRRRCRCSRGAAAATPRPSTRRSCRPASCHVRPACRRPGCSRPATRPARPPTRCTTTPTRRGRVGTRWARSSR